MDRDEFIEWIKQELQSLIVEFGPSLTLAIILGLIKIIKGYIGG